MTDLGAVCLAGKTTFAIWSPDAERVTLRLYENGNGGSSLEEHSLACDASGVWRIAFDQELHGTYYDYEIQSGGISRITADPYAKACGVNGARSMAVDLAKTDPSGWAEDSSPKRDKEDIVYEVHVKEFSWDPAGGFPEETRGTYRAFCQENTTLNGDGVHPTGLTYLKNLGVTHIQLMPIYDFGSVDETGPRDSFNWGYDPVNYNVPEGSYSTDPYHGEVRIRELKELVQSLHKNGFRVIMDVVYNHTYSADSWLGRTVPGYYYRLNKDGSPSNGSGCGNDLASEQPMCGDYILESVLYWASEYHMDGFRFDLMGLLDVKLMNRIRCELDRQYGKGEKLLYGEPWAAAATAMKRGSIPALKRNIRKLDHEIGAFCDQTRDALKGHVFQTMAQGFVNGGSGCEQAILNSVTAWCGEEKGSAKAPSQVITYASSHDNMTLWDKLILSMGKMDFHTKDEAALRANRLTAAIYLTCQGRPFLLSGEEFARTKEGLDDSYRAPVETNRLDWSRAYEFGDLREYYQGLLGLRKQLPGLCDKSSQAMERVTDKKIQSPGCVSFQLDNRRGWECPWPDVWVAYNAGEERACPLPEGEWELLADGARGDWWRDQSRPHICGEIIINSASAVILGRKEN